MIIVCPSCSSRFFVDDIALSQGRKVRCSDCKHVWFQEAVESVDDSSSQTAVENPESDISEQELSNDADAVNDAGDKSGLENIEENSALKKSIPTNLNPVEDDGFYNPEDAEASLLLPEPEESETNYAVSWLGVLFIFVFLIGATAAGGIFAKESIVKIWPPIVKVYDFLGLEIPYVGKGLGLNNLMVKRAEVQGKNVLLVRGRVDNETDLPIYIPALRIELKEGDTVIQEWTTPDEHYAIKGGETVPFEYGLPDPKYGGSSISVYFIASEAK